MMLHAAVNNMAADLEHEKRSGSDVVYLGDTHTLTLHAGQLVLLATMCYVGKEALKFWYKKDA